MPMTLIQLLSFAVFCGAHAMAAPVPSTGPRLGDEPQVEDPPLPPAYLPMLSIQSITPGAPSSAVADGFFQLTPAKCSGAACRGFRVSNSANFSGNTNTVVFAPVTMEAMVEPFGIGLYEIGQITITNGGFMQPTDARMALVPLSTSVTVSTPGVNKPTKFTLKFQVMWSLGSPAPANQAGLFALVTRNPIPAANFTVAMTGQVSFPMHMQLVGFKADPKQGTNIEVLGDWGQPKPSAGEPGPRVFVKQGAAQVIRLYARICNIDNPNNSMCQSNLAKSG